MFEDELKKACNARFDHEHYGLKSNHRILAQHPTMSDELPGTFVRYTHYYIDFACIFKSCTVEIKYLSRLYNVDNQVVTALFLEFVNILVPSAKISTSPSL